MTLNVSATNFKGDQNFSRAYMSYDINIIDLTLFKINIMASPFLLLNYFVGRKYRCETTKHKTVPNSYCT